MDKPQDFYTRSDIAVKFQLKTPDDKDSNYHLLVLGTESTPWRKNRRDSLLEKLSLSLNDSKKVDSTPVPKVDDDRKTVKLLSSIVVGWNFEQAFTVKAVEDLLYNSPYIMDDLDTFISNRENFLKKK